MKYALFWVIAQRIVNLEERIDTCPETSVTNCHYTLRKNPDVRRSHLLRGGSVKPSCNYL
jgi:hypothetical protein